MSQKRLSVIDAKHDIGVVEKIGDKFGYDIGVVQKLGNKFGYDIGMVAKIGNKFGCVSLCPYFGGGKQTLQSIFWREG